MSCPAGRPQRVLRAPAAAGREPVRQGPRKGRAATAQGRRSLGPPAACGAQRCRSRWRQRRGRGGKDRRPPVAGGRAELWEDGSAAAQRLHGALVAFELFLYFHSQNCVPLLSSIVQGMLLGVAVACSARRIGCNCTLDAKLHSRRKCTQPSTCFQLSLDLLGPAERPRGGRGLHPAPAPAANLPTWPPSWPRRPSVFVPPHSPTFNLCCSAERPRGRRSVQPRRPQ